LDTFARARKNNIIPDQAELGLTVRSYKADVRKQALAAITRITKGEALAAGATKEPLIEHYESTDSVYTILLLRSVSERRLKLPSARKT